MARTNTTTEEPAAVYCQRTTVRHPVSRENPDCVEPIKSIFFREGGSGCLFDKETALNLDKVEKRHRRDQQQETMDMAMGLNNQKMLLVELKLLYKNPAKISQDKIRAKIEYSRLLLTGEKPIEDVYLFLFSSKVKEQAKSYLHKMSLAHKRKLQSMSEEEFYAKYFSSCPTK